MNYDWENSLKWHSLLGSTEHGGFLFFRTSLQCVQQLSLPAPPYLVGVLLQRWEIPWAKVCLKTWNKLESSFFLFFPSRLNLHTNIYLFFERVIFPVIYFNYSISYLPYLILFFYSHLLFISLVLFWWFPLFVYLIYWKLSALINYLWTHNFSLLFFYI